MNACTIAGAGNKLAHGFCTMPTVWRVFVLEDGPAFDGDCAMAAPHANAPIKTDTPQALAFIIGFLSSWLFDSEVLQ
ncbi:hypothetical protein [Dyella caseinilytica]|uniref:Uncharacterized protein n=1 Tax=Dyella caseinilytica TaxID=1849581 RepID=A0ABX7H017_9GAMM|nr:hypothetical protein [Dyella caseinilytica]QRN55546.1 hypothetical protein ISN74_09590 [Dyella caseinilytica]